MKNLNTFLLRAIAIALLFSTCFTHAETREATFNNANIAYQEGHYPEAISLYESVIENGDQSANLHFNLGNSHYKLQAWGPAILHFKRALILDPGNPDIEMNIRLAQEAAELTPQDPGIFERLATVISVNTWTWIAVSSFWIALALAILPRLYGIKNAFPWIGVIFCMFLVMASLVGLTGYHFKSKEGVVIAADAPLKTAPTTNSTIEAYLGSGEIAIVKNRHESHFYIETTNGQKGWMSHDHFAKAWDY